jgi:allantoin racemase
MRIKYIIPLPFGEEGVANRAAQIPRHILGDATDVECVAARNAGTIDASHLDLLVFDMYVTEAGLRAEEEGYDAVVMDTVTDAALQALRSRLTIPVLGPGLVAYAIAVALGRRFSIISMWDKWRAVYQKNLDLYGLRDHCASIRSIGTAPDPEALFAGKEEEMAVLLTAEARHAIDEDGADVIILGSTTMHQAGRYMAEHLPCPVINPGPVAIKMAETLVQLGLSHSKVCYPSPSENVDDRFFSLVGAAAGR